MNVTSNQFDKLIARDNNGKCKVVFVSDCAAGGSVFDIQNVNKVNNPNPSEMISFAVNKVTDHNSKVGRRSHGIFTYYFCKIIYDDPSISPKRLVERLNASLARFSGSIDYQMTNTLAEDEPMYKPCSHPTADPVDEIIEEEEEHPETVDDTDEPPSDESDDDGEFFNETETTQN